MQIATIGLDIAKNVFQLHGIDAAEKVVVRKQLRRSQVLAFFEALPPCLVGMEACATAHYWARGLTKLGHQVRLMPAKDVKAYVSGSWRWRSPTRWRALPGRCWPGAAAIRRLRLRQRRKGSGKSRVSLRLCAYELQG